MPKLQFYGCWLICWLICASHTSGECPCECLLGANPSKMKSPLNLFSLVSAILVMIKANQWDEGLDADLPFPKVTAAASNHYPYLSPGTVMPERQVGKPKAALRQWSGRLDYKRDASPFPRKRNVQSLTQLIDISPHASTRPIHSFALLLKLCHAVLLVSFDDGGFGGFMDADS